MKNVAQRFTDPLAFVVTRARSLGGDVAPETFRRRNVGGVGIAVNFTGGKERDPRIVALRQF